MSTILVQFANNIEFTKGNFATWTKFRNLFRCQLSYVVCFVQRFWWCIVHRTLFIRSKIEMLVVRCRCWSRQRKKESILSQANIEFYSWNFNWNHETNVKADNNIKYNCNCHNQKLNKKRLLGFCFDESCISTWRESE